MYLDSLPFLATLAHSFTFAHHGIPDWTPTPGVFDVNAAAPVWMGLANLELGIEFTHAGLRAKHTGLTSEVTCWPVKLCTTPRTSSDLAPTAGGERLTRFPCIETGFRTKLLPFWNLGVAMLAGVIGSLSPSSFEITNGGTVAWFAAILRLKLASAVNTVRCHVPIITYGFEISEEYCRIARERLERIDAQPSLFQPKPEQTELGI